MTGGFLTPTALSTALALPNSTKSKLKWFPKHMNDALLRMQALIKQKRIQMIIEVRDARMPFGTANTNLLSRLFPVQNGSEQVAKSPIPVLTVFSKSDLACKKRFAEAMAKHGETFIPEQLMTLNVGPSTNGFLQRWMHRFFGDQQFMEMRERILRVPLETSDDDADADIDDSENHFLEFNRIRLRLLVLGLPNTGKSSFINALRKAGIKTKGGKAAPIGALPGVTRICGQMICIRRLKDRSVYVLDSPGVTAPEGHIPEEMARLALLGLVLLPHTQGQDPTADYLDMLLPCLLRVLNTDPANQRAYCNFLKLPGPTEDLELFAEAAARRLGLRRKEGDVLDLDRAAFEMIRMFRKGDFGPVFLD